MKSSEEFTSFEELMKLFIGHANMTALLRRFFEVHNLTILL